MLLGCNTAAEIMNVKDGTILTRIAEITGVDEVWFNPGDDRYYSGSFGIPAMGVIDANTHKFIINIPTIAGFHGQAASSLSNEVFVPNTGEGIVIYKAGR